MAPLQNRGRGSRSIKYIFSVIWLRVVAHLAKDSTPKHEILYKKKKVLKMLITIIIVITNTELRYEILSKIIV